MRDEVVFGASGGLAVLWTSVTALSPTEAHARSCAGF
jgi:hypothetical protein